MKKSVLSISAACLFAMSFLFTLQSCQKKDKEGTYVLTIPTIYFQANAHAANSEFYLVDTTIASGLLQAMNDAGVSMDNVKSAKLKSAVLRIDDAGVTFDPFTYANAHVKAGSLPLQQIAFKASIPHTGISEVTFDSEFAELADYLKQSNIDFIVKGYNETDVPATNYRFDVSFDVVYDIVK